MKIYQLLLIILLLISCNQKKDDTQIKNVPEIFRTNYGKIKDENLKLKYGDIVKLNIKNQYIEAIVLDIKQEDNIKWFGLCFLENQKLFGRKIPKGFGEDCIELFDFSYLNEKGLTNYTVVKNLKIKFKKVGIGSNSPVLNYKELLRDYKFGLERRKLKETPCSKKSLTMKSINECYVDIESIGI
jgi:hypothetical protein